MNSINLMNVPSERRLFCLTNYNAFATVVDNGGDQNYIDLPRLEPIFAVSLEEAKHKLAVMLDVDISLMTEWELVGEEDGFCPSISIGYKVGAMEAGYSFDVYTTVNTIHLLED
jgi:hypothetical protein